MGLLRRRMMMGAKQSEFQLVEVENVSDWAYQVTDDAREYGWTLEKPYHLGFSSIAAWKYILMLTDSPFICADTVDADVNVVSDFNVFVPAIGKYSVGQTTYSQNRDIPTASALNETNLARAGYPQSKIYDSLGREWIKIVVAGNAYNSQLHKTISYKSMPVYYCPENSLGKVFPKRTWGEVRNVSVWTASVTDDAREVGFTLEKPYHLCFSRLWSSAAVHLLTDADFLCMDVPDNDNTIMTDRNLYIPAIGYYNIGAISQSETQNITASAVVNGSHNLSYVNLQAPYKVVVDSRNRRWIRVPIDGLSLDNVHHKCVSYRSSDMPIYYCTAENLGEMFPNRVWDKKYTKINLFHKSERNTVVNNTAFTGLNYSSSRSTYLTHEQNGAPAYYNGTLEGYLAEIPTNADQLRILYDSSIGGPWVGLFYENLTYSSYGWRSATDSTITNTEGTRFVSITANTTNDIKATIYAIEEW